MKLSKTSIIFICIMVGIALACVINVTVDYIRIANNIATSAPAWIAFLEFIPYMAVELIVAVIWLIMRKKHGNK